MQPEAFRKLCEARTRRADELALRYPESREALSFFAAASAFQASIPADEPMAARSALVDLVIARGPETLQLVARDMSDEALQDALSAYRTGRDRTSPRSFFARVLLQSWAARSDPVPGTDSQEGCPRCGHPPQVGCQRPLGDGTAWSLVCGLCFEDWPHPRGRCAGCGEAEESRLAYYRAAELEQIEVQTCESCHRYLHWVRFQDDPDVVPDADEIAALPLDVWAREKGFRKLSPNLIGI